MDPEEGEPGEDVTRCVCGSIELVPEDDVEEAGLFVQCEKCLVWQHGYCVGLMTESQVPETYYCELCRPDLHRIIQRPKKPRRSKYLGVPDASSPPRPESDDAPHLEPRKRRSTMNSRDTAYDRQLEQALLLSAQQSNVVPQLPTRGSTAGLGAVSAVSGTRDAKRQRTPSPELSRDEKKKPRRSQASRSSSSKKKGGSKKAAAAALQQAQLAAQHQQQQVKEEQDQGLGDEEIDTVAAPTATRPKSGRDRSRRQAASVAGDSPLLPHRDTMSREGTPLGSGLAGAQVAGPGSTGIGSIPGEVYLTPRKRTRATKQGPAITGSRQAAATLQALPLSQVKTLADMRKRVSALLDYLGRTQMEIALEREDWAAFLDGGAAADGEDDKDIDRTVWQYGQGEGGSMQMMEKLTSELLQWEAKYS